MRVVAAMMLAVMALCAQAQEEETIIADRPGLADGSATVPGGVVQLETGLTAAGGDEETLALPTLLRIGFGERFEVRIASDLVERSAGDTDVAPVAAGFKLRLTTGEMPISLLASVQPPSGGGRLRSTDFESEVRVVSDIELGSGFALTPNVGVGIVEGGEATGLFAMTLEKAIGNALPFVDFETTFGGGETAVIADAGVAWIVRADTQLDVSAGVDVAGDAYPEWFIAAGFSRRF